ncbi:hypothetical protein F0562_030228 [Nyssa sinensis]|uniref:Uncharacterized protein n=1 Tax=Nyssa sinensis TaxID=561372 RepID=A0A5J5AVU9_9ASTE|nr:hypothetical protein F0562_030228 [Nyssa sinensis]
MASNSILNSSSSEQRWADQMSRMLKKDVVIDINEVGPSVFEVPKSMSALKPEAYTPQLIGLGPYHHFRLELYQMQRSKLAAAKGVLKPDQILNFEELMIHGLKEFEPTIRMCYNKYLDLDPNTLAWILAIDGLFLLHFFNTDPMHKHNQDHFSGDKLKNDAIISDIMMVENQILVFLLKRILMTSCTVYGDDTAGPSSPLEGKKEPFSLDANHVHLLDLIYHLIVNKRGPTPDGGSIRDIEFSEKELTFYLLVINLNVNLEVILRNLVAYEVLSAKPRSTLEFAEYVDLMSVIIDDAEDVRLLKEAGIIQGSLVDEEIGNIFNRISY